MREHESKKNIKVLFAIIGFVFIVGLIGIIIMLTAGNDSDDVKEVGKNGNMEDVVPGEVVKKSNKLIFTDNSGKEHKVEKYIVNSDSKRESTVTYKGEKYPDSGFSYYSVEPYDNYYWAHLNNVTKFLEMQYPIDKFTVIDIYNEGNTPNVNVLVMSESKGEFLLYIQVNLNNPNEFMITLNEYHDMVMNGSDSESESDSE